MSKADAQRAFREANFARRQAAKPKTPSAAAPTSTAEKPPKLQVDVSPMIIEKPVETDSSPKCGHRNMGNKPCQRPLGHSEKSHRYK